MSGNILYKHQLLFLPFCLPLVNGLHTNHTALEVCYNFFAEARSLDTRWTSRPALTVFCSLCGAQTTRMDAWFSCSKSQPAASILEAGSWTIATWHFADTQNEVILMFSKPVLYVSTNYSVKLCSSSSSKTTCFNQPTRLLLHDWPCMSHSLLPCICWKRTTAKLRR